MGFIWPYELEHSVACPYKVFPMFSPTLNAQLFLIDSNLDVLLVGFPMLKSVFLSDVLFRTVSAQFQLKLYMVKSYTTARSSLADFLRFICVFFNDCRETSPICHLYFFQVFRAGLFFVAVVLNDAETVLIDDSSELRYDLCLSLK